MTDSAITPDDFRRASGLWATGVSIVTTTDASGKPYGLTMNAVGSLSLDPPLFLVCVDLKSDTLAPMSESKTFCINMLTSAQQDLSNGFAKKGTDKFNNVNWTTAATGAPVIADTLVSIDCAVQDVLQGGDHKIFCGEVRAIIDNTNEAAEPLLFFKGRYAAIA